jgi:hypothetical protein
VTTTTQRIDPADHPRRAGRLRGRLHRLSAAGTLHRSRTGKPAFIHANVPQISGVSMPSHDFDGRGRIMFPAYLLAAHKAD